MAKLVNAYAVNPSAIEPGDVMCYVVKAMVTYRDPDGQLRYRIYRCPWDGTSDDVPQGSPVSDPTNTCKSFFPSLAMVAEPG